MKNYYFKQVKCYLSLNTNQNAFKMTKKLTPHPTLSVHRNTESYKGQNDSTLNGFFFIILITCCDKLDFKGNYNISAYKEITDYWAIRALFLLFIP